MPNIESLEIHITRSGLRATAARCAVLQVFRSSSQRRHLNAEQVFRALQGKRPGMALGLVYRVLSQFVEAGLLTRHQFAGGTAMFELDEGQPHDHLVCLRCGRVEEFRDDEIDRQRQALANRLGFTLTSRPVSLRGACSSSACDVSRRG